MMKHKSLRRLMAFASILLLVGCTDEKTDREVHYFLKGYDELQFQTRDGVVVHPSQYIQPEQRNGYRIYEIRDTTLTLTHRRTDERYDGYIRTFHRDRYNLNLQGEFEDGKMFRLRYWHPNRTLGMDADYRKNTLSLWNRSGSIVVESNPEETYYYYPGMNAIKEIINDTMRSYFDKEGELERYTIYSDSARTDYAPGGQKIESYTYSRERGEPGLYREWYLNGQLKIKGRFNNGQEAGTWIRYDSLGNIEEEIAY